MFCDNCNEREATVNITHKNGDEEIDLYLCDKCIDGEPKPEKITFSSLISEIIETKIGGENKNSKKCPNCGMDFSEFKVTGVFGCSKCYETFSNSLDAILGSIHGANVHIGKTPEIAKDEVLLQRKINKKKEKLKKYVEKEEFEKAAQLRDEIKECEKNDGG